MPTRTDRRAMEREDERILRRGMPLREDLAAAQAQTRRLLRILRDAANPRRAGDAAAELHAGYELSYRHNRPTGLDCRRGCAHCCRIFVSVTAPELFLIARSLTGARREAILGRLAAADERVHGLDAAARRSAGVTCPMLEDGACSIYTVRPTACRSLLSFDVNACISAFVEGQEGGRAMAPVGPMLRSGYMAALCAALDLAGLPDASYELVSGLRRVLETPDAEARWLAGEPVLEGLPQDRGRNEQFRAAVAYIARSVAQAWG
ncbi:YkgJ family cysteine cluster protein [Arenibaculum pallidiluteum]|uniref:YkgJ family cysteine cluster protein n=1 Tax=Arenibaculum pallidiluteum TaxID=2812559 RepID=UPI001A96BE68|nr:YkgJ family cysteine cluster protein [Arenibaculum pallidiluteum]